jgi:hypothetical protein
MRRVAFAAFLVLLPVVALAQDVVISPPAPWWQSLLGSLPIATVVAVIFGALGLLNLSNKRKQIVAMVAKHAYNVVNDIDHVRGDEKLDKVVEGLRQADEWMKANGWRLLSAEEQALVKMQFQAMHGAELATKVGAVSPP